MAMSTQWNTANITVYSTLAVQQLVPRRGLLLLIPAGVVLLINIILAALLVYSYRRAKIPEMQQARTSEMIYSTQNQSIRKAVKEIRRRSEGPLQLELLKVRYSVVEEEQANVRLLCVAKDLNPVIPGYELRSRAHTSIMGSSDEGGSDAGSFVRAASSREMDRTGRMSRESPRWRGSSQAW